MSYASIYEYLPEIAKKETRSIWVSGEYSGSIPPGNYGLLEFYCTDLNCDCRRVMLHVISERENRIVAVVNFGWESRRFYEKWFGGTDKEWIDELKGPCLNTGSFQASYANELLALIQDLVVSDQAYVSRLKKHYEAFKRITDAQQAGFEDRKREAEAVEKIGRNDPCTCGSGRKYKKCCGA